MSRFPPEGRLRAACRRRRGRTVPDRATVPRGGHPVRTGFQVTPADPSKVIRPGRHGPRSRVPVCVDPDGNKIISTASSASAFSLIISQSPTRSCAAGFARPTSNPAAPERLVAGLLSGEEAEAGEEAGGAMSCDWAAALRHVSANGRRQSVDESLDAAGRNSAQCAASQASNRCCSLAALSCQNPLSSGTATLRFFG